MGETRDQRRPAGAAEERGHGGCVGTGQAVPVHVEHGVKQRLNIRKHFPALDGSWEAEPDPSWEPTLRGQEGLGGPPVRAGCLSHRVSWIPPSLLNFNASSSCLLQPPSVRSPHPI